MFGNKKETNKDPVIKNDKDGGAPKQRPAHAKAVDVGKIDTLISESCKIEGTIHSDYSIKISGKVSGSITAKDTVVISQHGQVTGDIEAKTLIVYGQMTGNSTTEVIHIQDEGFIEGDVKTSSLQVEPTATYKGAVLMSGKPSSEPAVKSLESNLSSHSPLVELEPKLSSDDKGSLANKDKS